MRHTRTRSCVRVVALLRATSCVCQRSRGADENKNRTFAFIWESLNRGETLLSRRAGPRPGFALCCSAGEAHSAATARARARAP